MWPVSQLYDITSLLLQKCSSNGFLNVVSNKWTISWQVEFKTECWSAYEGVTWLSSMFRRCLTHLYLWNEVAGWVIDLLVVLSSEWWRGPSILLYLAILLMYHLCLELIKLRVDPQSYWRLAKIWCVIQKYCQFRYLIDGAVALHCAQTTWERWEKEVPFANSYKGPTWSGDCSAQRFYPRMRNS